MKMREVKAQLQEAGRRTRIITGHGFKASFDRCERCGKRKGNLYKRGDESCCILCFRFSEVPPRDREQIAAEMFPGGGFAILADGEPAPWAR